MHKAACQDQDKLTHCAPKNTEFTSKTQSPNPEAIPDRITWRHWDVITNFFLMSSHSPCFASAALADWYFSSILPLMWGSHIPDFCRRS